MYEELYSPIPDTEAYLRRIGLGGKAIEINEDNLSTLVRAHLTSVAFENIDVWAEGKCPSLAVADLFDKVVTRRRGGYCFELNSLFCALLRSLGFTAHLAAAYIVSGRDFLPPPTHCVVLVNIDGKKYFCDVGFGALMPQKALNLSVIDDDDFFIEREGEFFALHTPGGRTLVFRDIAIAPVDLIAPNYFVSQNPCSPLRAELVMRLAFPNGSVSINANEFKLRRGDKCEEFTISSQDELKQIIEKHFGICADDIVLKNI